LKTVRWPGVKAMSGLSVTVSRLLSMESFI
jgi:hypothetical protein